MRGDRSSGTAMLVAALRAVASLGDDAVLADRAAVRFLPRSWAGALELAERRGQVGLVRWLPDLVSRGRLQHIALRTRVIDEHLARLVVGRPRQLVFLGAGFDTRAYRLAALAGCRCFEVDHPATQRKKRARVAGLREVVKELRFVPVDFEREELGVSLTQAGFEPAESSVFVWEGVTMYLTRDALRATLAALRALMVLDSYLIVTTYDRSGASGPLSRSTSLLASLLGERLRTYLSPAEAAALLAEFGFVVEEDSGRDDWAAAFAVPPRGAAPERVIVARRA